MNWVLAGIAFALAVAMAIGTAAVRAENALRRYAVERAYRESYDRFVELSRLRIEQLAQTSSARLAEANWRQLRAEAARRQGMLQ